MSITAFLDRPLCLCQACQAEFFEGMSALYDHWALRAEDADRREYLEDVAFEHLRTAALCRRIAARQAAGKAAA